jgi:Mn2+/Fe2+ NRAMP family transporter
VLVRALVRRHLSAMLRILRNLGPGLLLAATSIGGSHIALAPTAGARFGYDLLWLVILAHLFKYHAFEFGPRLALGANMSLLEGYRRLPGPKNWALWTGIVDMCLESIGVLAAVAGFTGSILAASFGGATPLWTVGVVVVAGAMLAIGRYRLLTIATGLMLLGLAVGTGIAFFSAPPSPSEVGGGLLPSYPAGSLLLVAAILGWMPTGVGVSIWHSLWIREDRRFQPDPQHAPGTRAYQADRLEKFRRGIRDMRMGYGLSAALAVMFLGLGAAVLRPAGLVPEGVDTALTLSRIYTDRLGAWMEPVFLIVAFAAMFSTTYTVMDGMPRTLTAAWRHIRGVPDADRADRGRLYWGYLVAMTLGSLAVVAVVSDPIRLITILAAVTFLFSPLWFVLNTWSVTRFVTERKMRPSKLEFALAGIGIVFMIGTAALLIYTDVLRSSL